MKPIMKTVAITVMAALVLTMGLLAFLNYLGESHTQPSPVATVDDQPSPVATVDDQPSSVATVDDQVVDTIAVSSSLVAKDVPQLIESSDIIACGTVVSKNAPIKILPVFGGDFSIFSDFIFEIENSYLHANATPENSSVSVRIHGGTVDGLNVIVEEAPVLEVGGKYLLFLYRPGRGGGYNTVGDYYYVNGASQGIYIMNENEYTRQLSGTNIEIEVLQSLIAEYEATGTPRITALEEFTQNQIRNLDSGAITEEEYETFITNANTYATIID
jgi:hypothetical protein